MCQPRSVAAALATQKEQAVCDVIAYQGYPQALIQHQAELLLAGCKASQRPLSCKLASISTLTFELHTPACTRPFAAIVWLQHLLIINTQQQTQHTSYTGMPVHEDTCTHPKYVRMPSRAGAAVLWAQAQGPSKLWHMHSCQL